MNLFHKKSFILAIALFIIVTIFQPAPKVQADVKVEQNATVLNLDQIDLSISKELNITRPKETFSTKVSTYFITSTSNPNEPLYVNDEEIERLGTQGTFGYLAELSDGENVYIFSQGDTEKTITITKKEAATSTDIALIDYITEDSLMPSGKRILVKGEILEIKCVGPSEANIVAFVDGDEIELTQIATADKGVPATFKGSYTVGSDYPSEKTTSLGKIKYLLAYDDVESEYYSSGELFVKDSESKTAVTVSSYLGYVYYDTSNLTVFKELLKKGAKDYIITQTGGYFQLASGGFIPASMVQVLEDSGIDNKITSVEHGYKPNGEYYKLSGSNTPAYFVEHTDGALKLTLYNTSLDRKLTFDATSMFSSITAVQKDTSTVITFVLAEDSDYWGYNIVFSDDNSVFLEMQKKPQVKSFLRPLSGMTIMIDPGHGGSDPGALGVAGKLGPAESDVNMAHSLAIKDKLEALGATVYLSRNGDIYYDLDNRLRDFANLKCDLFIAIHHNSIAETKDANDITGTEIYYHTPVSQEIAKSIQSSIIAQTGRKDRGVYESYYRVTIPHYAPSMLVELGFMSNPLEYENACDVDEIDNVANAVAMGILNYFYE